MCLRGRDVFCNEKMMECANVYNKTGYQEQQETVPLDQNIKATFYGRLQNQQLNEMIDLH